MVTAPISDILVEIIYSCATRSQQNLSAVVKNLNSTHLFGNLHADYLLHMKIPYPGPTHLSLWKNLDLSIITSLRCDLIEPALLSILKSITCSTANNLVSLHLRNVQDQISRHSVVLHHFMGTGLRCVPPTCIVHHIHALCTMVCKRYLCL